MNFRKFLSVFLALVMLISLLPLSAAAETTVNTYYFTQYDNYVDYTATDGYATITSAYLPTLTELVIPTPLYKYNVVAITGLVTNSQTNTKSISLPSTLESVTGNPFSDFKGLTSISVENGGKYYTAIDNSLIFLGDWSLSAFPAGIEGSYTTPEGVVSVSSYAFQNSSLTELVLSEGVLSTDKYFASDSSIENVVIPSSVSNIDPQAFVAAQNIKSIDVDPANEIYSSENGVLFNKDKTELYYYPSNSGAEEYTVPDSVKTLSLYSFVNNNGLKRLFIGKNVETISCDFTSCSALDDIYYFGTESEWETISKASSFDSVTVHFIAAAEFEDIDNISATVIYGNDPYLPSSAKGIKEDGEEITENIAWDFSPINGPGHYTVKGRIYGYEKIYEAQIFVLPCVEAIDDTLRYYGRQDTTYQAHMFQGLYSGNVHFEFDLELINAVDGIVAFSSGNAVYSTEAIGILPNSPISARDGGSWKSFYTPTLGAVYRFDIETDTQAHTWSGTMTTPEGEVVTVADNYSYRTNQDYLSRILLTRNTSTAAYVDDVYLTNLKISLPDSYIPVSGIDMPAFFEMTEDTYSNMDISVLPSKATNQNIICTSSDESIITYRDGVLHAVSPGTATLTATTVDGGYSASCTVTVVGKDPLFNGLIAYYPFEDDSTASSEIIDASGNGNNALVVSNHSIPIVIINGTAHFFGNIESGYTGAALKLPNLINRDITDFTYSAWIRADSTYTYASKLVRFFDFGNIASNNARNSIFMRYTISSGELYFCDRLPNIYLTQTYSDKPFTDKWGLLTVTYEYDSNSGYYNVVTYINGVKQEALSSSARFTRSLTDLGELTDSSNGLLIGRTVWSATNQNIDDNPDFCGDMDEIRLYNRALSAEEVLDLYENHKPSKGIYADLKIITQADGAVVSENYVSAVIDSSYTYTDAPSLMEYDGEIYVLDEDSSTLSIQAVSGSEDEAIIVNYKKADEFTYDKPQFLTCIGAVPELPEVLTINVNGENADYNINWNSTSFDEKGEYAVSGTIDGTNVSVYSEGRVFPRYNGTLGGDLTVNYYVNGSLRRSGQIEQGYGTKFTLTAETVESFGIMYAFEGADGAVSEIGGSAVLDELYQQINLYYTLKNTIEGEISAEARAESFDETSIRLSIDAEVFNLTDTDETVSLLAIDYDQKGRSDIVYEEKINLSRATEKIETISAEIIYTQGQYNNLEILLWTDDLMPLTDIVSVNALEVKPYLSEEVLNMIPTFDSASSAIRMANSYWQSTYPYPYSDTTGGTHAAFWDKAAYQLGNIEAYKLLGDEDYLTYAVNWAEYCEWKGNNNSGDPSSWTWGYNQNQGSSAVLFGDWQICFQAYIDLYNLGVEGADLSRVKEVMGYQVTTDEDSYCWWADALYMVMPVMTKMYNLTGDEIYLDKLYEWFKYAKELMYDGEGGIPTSADGYTTSASLNSGAQYSDPDNYAHLFFRDAGYVYPLNPNPGHETEKNFWSRGNGWVFAALAKALSDMPEYFEHYSEFYDTYVQMAAAIIACQQTDQNGYGFWTQSLLQDYPKGTNGNDEGYETSGTAFFTYGLFWGINNGILDEDTYLEPAVRAWGYLSEVALQSDGKLGYVQPIGSNATQATPVTTTQNFGVGAFLLASCEAARWANK